MNMKIIFALSAFLFASVGCGKAGAPDGERPLAVGWALWTGWYPMAIAQELKLFEKHGVAVKPILYKDYTEILPDLGSGKLDAGFSGMYETLKANIPGIKIVLVTDHSEGAEGLIVAPNIKSAQDLRGARIGIQGALSGSEFLITTYLRRFGILPRDLIMLNVAPEHVLDHMPERIQGGYTWDPYLTQAKTRGFRLLFTTADMPGLIVDIVAFKGGIAKERPDDIRKFTEAWFEAIEYWKREPSIASGMIVKVTGLKPEEVTTAGCRIFNRQENLDTFKPGNSYESIFFTARKQVEFFISMGDASTAPNLDEILTSAYMK